MFTPHCCACCLERNFEFSPYLVSFMVKFAFFSILLYHIRNLYLLFLMNQAMVFKSAGDDEKGNGKV